MSQLLDKFIDCFKWPVAIYMFLSLPALIQSADYFNFINLKFIVLFIGLVCFIFVKISMDPSMRLNIQVLAHELSHSIFALLTFHKIKHLHINADDTGGEMGFTGRGNFLIIIAPYFFPFFALIYMIVMSFLPEHYMYNGLLGFFLGYHLDTVLSQIHPKQTDLPKVGYLFCILFLPGINLFVIGLILAFNSRGWGAFIDYFSLVNHLNIENFNKFLEYIKMINPS